MVLGLRFKGLGGFRLITYWSNIVGELKDQPLGPERIDYGWVIMHPRGLKVTIEYTHRALSSSLLWSIFRIPEGNPQKRTWIWLLVLTPRRANGAHEEAEVVVRDAYPQGLMGTMVREHN